MTSFYIHCVKCGSKHLNTSPKVMLDEYKRYTCKACYLEDPFQLKRNTPNIATRAPNVIQTRSNVYDRSVGLTWSTIPFKWNEITDDWEDR